MDIKHVIDLTHTITPNTPVHPYDEQMVLKQIRILQENKYCDYQLTTGMHVGTHIDGPAHQIAGGLSLAQFPPNNFIKPGVLLDARNKNLDVALLENTQINPGDIVLILTLHDKKFGSEEYFADYPAITPSLAQKLIAQKITMVGVDAPSPDYYPFPIHKMFLKENILIIENLTGLEQLIDINHFFVAALPLKIEADSAPARVVAFF